jgi:hypothetical protein
MLIFPFQFSFPFLSSTCLIIMSSPPQKQKQHIDDFHQQNAKRKQFRIHVITNIKSLLDSAVTQQNTNIIKTQLRLEQISKQPETSLDNKKTEIDDLFNTLLYEEVKLKNIQAAKNEAHKALRFYEVSSAPGSKSDNDSELIIACINACGSSGYISFQSVITELYEAQKLACRLIAGPEVYDF